MGRHAKDYGERQAAAMETARWMLPTLHRAIDFGQKVVEVPVTDLKEILSYLEATAQREKAEFSGKHLGYGNPDLMRELLTRERASCPVLWKKSQRYTIEVFYREIPLSAAQIAKRAARSSISEKALRLIDEEILKNGMPS